MGAAPVILKNTGRAPLLPTSAAAEVGFSFLCAGQAGVSILRVGGMGHPD